MAVSAIRIGVKVDDTGIFRVIMARITAEGALNRVQGYHIAGVFMAGGTLDGGNFLMLGSVRCFVAIGTGFGLCHVTVFAVNRIVPKDP